MSTEQNGSKAGTSSLERLGSACECQNWADIDPRIRLLTGHHARCHRGGDPLEAAFKLLKRLTRGIECWAQEEDGEVYPDCWKPYREAKALEGVFLPVEHAKELANCVSED